MWPFKKKIKIEVVIKAEEPKPTKRYYTREEEYKMLNSIQFCNTRGGCTGLTNICNNCNK